MADACRGVSIRQLAWIHDWHVREETYAAALARIIDAHRALPLAAAWGDGTTSSSDGQFYKTGGHGAGTGDVNARHGNEPGVSFYTHVSDQYGPFHTKVIAASASEAPHVLDGLLYHQTGLAIEEHYTDTGGVTDHVFGLCHLLGFRFTPPIRDLKDRRLYLFPGDEAPPSLKPLVGGEIDLGSIWLSIGPNCCVWPPIPGRTVSLWRCANWGAWNGRSSPSTGCAIRPCAGAPMPA